MAENQHIYAAIDLKSFYASVECVSRKLDTLTTNLVVADVTRSEKTICLAVSPSLKACGIPGRPRLFEVVQKVREVNRQRLADAVRAHKAVRGADGKWSFASSSFDAAALQKDLSLELGYIVAPPRMATYIEYSTRIYQIYLKYVAPEDIHVYSIDEVFIDLTHYLPFYRMTAHELVTTMIREILYTTGITATAGIGTNLYLAKAAMDIGTHPADRLLAGGPRLRAAAAKVGAEHDGRYCAVFLRRAAGILQRGPDVQDLRRQRRAAHRPCLGLGADHDCRHQGV